MPLHLKQILICILRIDTCIKSYSEVPSECSELNAFTIYILLMCPNFFSFLNRVLLILIILTTLLLMFLWTTIKVVYYTRKENRERKERQKMHPDMETVRRDSKLAAIIEEYHLKTMHRLILKLLQPLSGGNLQKMVRRIKVNKF